MGGVVICGKLNAPTLMGGVAKGGMFMDGIDIWGRLKAERFIGGVFTGGTEILGVPIVTKVPPGPVSMSRMPSSRLKFWAATAAAAACPPPATCSATWRPRRPRRHPRPCSSRRRTADGTPALAQRELRIPGRSCRTSKRSRPIPRPKPQPLSPSWDPLRSPPPRPATNEYPPNPRPHSGPDPALRSQTTYRSLLGSLGR